MAVLSAPATVEIDTPLVLDSSQSHGPLDIVSVAWSEGELPLASTASTRLFPNGGIHTYRLTVTDSAGRSAHAEKTVAVVRDRDRLDRLATGINVEANAWWECNPSFIDSFFHGSNSSNSNDSDSWHPPISGGTSFSSNMFWGCGLDRNGRRYLAGTYTVRYRDYSATQSGPYRIDSEFDGRQRPLPITRTVNPLSPADIYWQGKTSVLVPNAGLWLKRSAFTTTPTDAGLKNLQVIGPGGSCRNKETKRIRLASLCDPDGSFVTSNPGLDPALKIETCPDYEECAPFTETVYTRGVDTADSLFQRTRQLLHPFYVQRLSHYSTLRFMDMEHTNGSTDVSWSARNTLDKAPSTDKAPWEIPILLANATRTDLWINIPHQADDDYVQHLASLVAKYLDPDLRVWVEYSNEVWNGGFPQYAWANAQGNALPGGGGVDAWIPYRSMQVWTPFDAALGRARVVHVQAHQLWADRFIGSLLRYDSYKQTDVLAIAPYFGVLPSGSPTTWTIDQIVASIDSGVDGAIAQSKAWMVKLLAFGMRHIKLVSYEGGLGVTTSHYGADEPTATAIVTQANYDPRLEAIHKRYYDGWRSIGGTLFNHFNNRGFYSKWGYWALRDYELTTTMPHPKESAFWKYGEANPKWWDENADRPGAPAPWELQRIGILAGNFQGDAVYFNDKIYLSGGGGWLNSSGAGATADHFTFLSQPINGNAVLTAHITEAMHTGFTTDGGLMFRSGSGVNDSYYAVTCGDGSCVARGRAVAGGSAANIGASVTLPTTDFWIRISRSGDTFSSSVSTDGATWSNLGSTTSALPASARIGAFENKGHWFNASPGADALNFNMFAISSWQLQ